MRKIDHLAQKNCRLTRMEKHQLRQKKLEQALAGLCLTLELR
jgi:hypothetical protein